MVDPNSVKETPIFSEPTEWKESNFGSTKPEPFMKINDETYMQVRDIKMVYSGEGITGGPNYYYTAMTRWIPTSMYLKLVSNEVLRSELSSAEDSKEIKESLGIIMGALADLYEKVSK